MASASIDTGGAGERLPTSTATPPTPTAVSAVSTAEGAPDASTAMSTPSTPPTPSPRSAVSRAPASHGSIVAAAPNRRASRRLFLSGSLTITVAPRSAAIAVADRPTIPAPVTRTIERGSATSRSARRSAAHAVAAPHAAGAATRAGMRSPTGTIAVPASTCTWVARPPLSSQCAPMRSWP
nr:hypothetical protein [uncultured Microbacterium sp.]